MFENATKKCCTCLLEKSANNFYKRNKGQYLYSDCKECFLKKCREYAKTEEGRNVRKRVKKKFRASNKYRQMLRSPEYKAKAKKWEENRVRREPQKVIARRRTRNAVYLGKIPSPSSIPCFKCGQTASQYHHPNGYDKEHQLDVVAVCIPCHYVIHEKMRENRLIPTSIIPQGK